MNFASLILICLLLLDRPALAGSIVEAFTSVTKNEVGTSTGVWNAVRGTLHVPHVVDRDNDGGSDTTMNIGDGSDGPFNSSTYSNFDTDAPGTPTQITLDSGRTYNFTSFTLNSGVTVTGDNDNSPLTIRVQGDVHIEGLIDLNGQNGSAVSDVFSTVPSGGTACCGGGAGGNGGRGNPIEAGSDGTSGNEPPGGDTGKGLGGASSSSATPTHGAGGGGGGGHGDYVAVTNDGENGAGGAAGGKGGGNAGNYDDVYLTDLFGGSGGAGGGGYDGNAAAGTNSSGGGGGGGGGALDLQVGGNVTITSTGIIRANGGAGGSQATISTHAGAGGGGSGGALRIFAGGTITNDGTLSAIGGSGGTGGNGGNGGAGSIGRVRYEDSDGQAINAGTPVLENPSPQQPSLGKTFYTTSAVILQSKSYDTGSDSPVFVSMLTEDSGSGTITYEIAGSSDDFASDDTGFLPKSSLSSLEGKRYVKFRVTLQSSDRTQTPEVSRITINYFSFSEAVRMSLASCGGAAIHDRKEPAWFISFLIYCLLLAGLPKLRRLFA